MSLCERYSRYMAERDRRIQNMSRVMAAAGTHVEEFALRRDGRDLIEAIRVCRTCRAADECSDWLRSASGSADGISFCPNIARFRSAG